MKELDELTLRKKIKTYELEQDDAVLQGILLNYYEPNKERYIKNYERNLSMLKNYKWLYGSVIQSLKDNMDKIIWESKDVIIVFKTIGRNFIFIERQDLIVKQESVPVVQNMLFLEEVEKILEKTRLSSPISWMQLPVYLFYTNKFYFALFMQLGDLSHILKRERIIFTIGMYFFKEVISDSQAILPNVAFNVGVENQDLKSVIENQLSANNEYEVQVSKQIHEWYKQHEENIANNIIYKRPRILFIASRFTTVLQYQTRDCMLACKQMGLEVLLHKEKSNIHRNSVREFLDIINKFRPDIIFMLDHFRIGRETYMPSEIRVISWLQDPLPHILDKETPLKLKENDFVLNHMVNYKAFEKAGYDRCNIMNATMRANHNIYTIRELSEEEYEMHATDICLIAHSTDYHEELDTILMALKPSIKEDELQYVQEILEEICINYYKEVYEEKVYIQTQYECEKYLKERLKTMGIVFGEKAMDFIVFRFFMYLRGCVFRSVMVEWLIDAKFTNLRLFGRNWDSNPKFKEFAMGIAQNGEELSRILQCSKIVLGTNINVSGVPRVYETFLSGSFYLGNYVDPQYDITDVRNILQENNEIVFFDGKNDLLEKVRYYLEHSEERKIIARRARDKILKTHTFSTLMEDTLNWVAETTKKR